MPGHSAGLRGHCGEKHKCLPCSHVLCNLEQSQTGEHGWIPEVSLTCQETKIPKPFEGKATGPEIDEPVSSPPQTVPDLLQPSLLVGTAPLLGWRWESYSFLSYFYILSETISIFRGRNHTFLSLDHPCHTACRILVAQPEIKPGPTAVKA